MLLIKTIYGSRLYGMNRDDSDTDIRLVYVPTYNDMVLGIKPKFDVVGDHEAFSLHAFLKGFAEGQSYALEIAHAPESAILECHGSWASVKAFLPEIYTRNIAATVDFARSMADRYAVRAERYNAVLHVKGVLQDLDPDKRLSETDIRDRLVESEHLRFSSVANADKTVRTLELCNRHYLLSNKVGHTLGQVQNLADSYGVRVARSADVEVDWKSIAHAYRLADEACEWLSRTFVTLPRPNKEYLKDIRYGRLPLSEVNTAIDNKLAELDVLIGKSTLPDKADYDKINNFVIEFYRDVHKREVYGP